ncbi:hypothetical protein [Micromonospora sagamiensis]|uniref:Uncharacterized protein n=1 Tax=Micromonospora sagamiensis TaxID=47875 RepID=A0A562WHF0_9ACTN|nr:hypothetical protein [Micromonospora sagamiensis]TWJ29686.1 hypothetical protein JD81_03197 [Micromonospora sagamiensis]
MEWIPVVGVVCGAVIALATALMVESKHNRALRRQHREAERVRHCLEFALALDAAHSALREVAQGHDDPRDRLRPANRAVHQAGVFAARERLLVSGTVDLVKAGELAYHRLIAVRNAVRSGATLPSREYHLAYHAFAEAVWQLRMAARADLDQAVLAPADLDRRSWSEREGCSACVAPAREGPGATAAATGPS